MSSWQNVCRPSSSTQYNKAINQRLCEEKQRIATATHKICLRKTDIWQNNNESVPRIENVLWQEGEEGGGHGWWCSWQGGGSQIGEKIFQGRNGAPESPQADIISHIASDICETLYLLSHIFTVYESGRDRAGWGSEQEASCWKPEGEDLPSDFDSISFCFRSKKRSRSWEGDQMPWRKCLGRRKTRLKSVSLHCLLSKTRSNKDLGNEMDALNLN